MAIEKNDKNSEKAIRISDEVIASISAIALHDLNGVVGTADASKFFGKNVKSEVKDGGIIVHIDVMVEYGINIPEVAWEIQRKIKKSVENMTGLTVHRVNVNIKDVKIDDEEKPEDK